MLIYSVDGLKLDGIVNILTRKRNYDDVAAKMTNTTLLWINRIITFKSFCIGLTIPNTVFHSGPYILRIQENWIQDSRELEHVHGKVIRMIKGPKSKFCEEG